MCQWYDKNGKPSIPNCYECPKCHYQHQTTTTMNMHVITKSGVEAPHMFCSCGKDLGKLS